MLKCCPFEKLHRDERLAILLADVINCADVGMVQGGGGLGLALEAAQSLRIAGNLIGQELEGDEAMQASVFSFVHHSHPPAAQLLDDAVVRDGLADQWRGFHPRDVMLGTLMGASQERRSDQVQRPVLQTSILASGDGKLCASRGQQ